jgi:hypothetical protein
MIKPSKEFTKEFNEKLTEQEGKEAIKLNNQLNAKQSLPDNYEIIFSQVNGYWSIFYNEPEAIRAELMADGFPTKEEAIEFLLFP